MEHVRLPLASKEYLLKRVEEEPLLKNSLECKYFNFKSYLLLHNILNYFHVFR